MSFADAEHRGPNAAQLRTQPVNPQRPSIAFSTSISPPKLEPIRIALAAFGENANGFFGETRL